MLFGRCQCEGNESSLFAAVLRKIGSELDVGYLQLSVSFGTFAFKAEIHARCIVCESFFTASAFIPILFQLQREEKDAHS